MPSTFHLRFFWGRRREGRGKCAERLLAFMAGLTQFDAEFSSPWFSVQGKPKPLQWNRASVDVLLKKGVSMTDLIVGYPRKPIRELGYGISMYCEGDSVSTLRINCGGYSDFVKNSLILSVPNIGAVGKRVFQNAAAPGIDRAGGRHVGSRYGASLVSRAK